MMSNPYEPPLSPVEKGSRRANERSQSVRFWHWLLLAGPPLATFVFCTVWYVLTFVALGPIGALLFFLTPLACAAWAFCLCRRLAGSSAALAVLLFTVELFLTLAAFLLLTPRWD